LLKYYIGWDKLRDDARENIRVALDHYNKMNKQSKAKKKGSTNKKKQSKLEYVPIERRMDQQSRESTSPRDPVAR
jgi:hypothetical protein